MRKKNRSVVTVAMPIVISITIQIAALFLPALLVSNMGLPSLVLASGTNTEGLKEYSFLLPKTQKLRLILNKAEIHIVSQLGQETTKVTLRSTENPESLVQIESESSAFEIKEIEFAKPKTLEITISGRSVPLDFFLREGRILGSGWKANLQGVLQKGQIQLTETESSMRLNVLEGEVSIGRHLGDLVLEGYNLTSVIKLTKGHLGIQQHMGTSTIESPEGTLKLLSQRGKISVQGGRGEMEVLIRQGSFEANGYDGSIQGATDIGPIKIRTLEAANLKIQSASGTVQITVPNQSAAGVNIHSDQAKLTLPKFLRVQDLGPFSVVRGQLKGEVPGKIFVKTQTGHVSLKTF